jgi:hypothetical protein
VGRFIKITCALAAIAILGIWFISNRVEKAGVICDTLTLTGDISPQTFFDAKDCLIQSTATNKTFVVAYSGGGNWESALALGTLIHRHGWDVEVVDLCASACAIFIFPAGKTKYLHPESLLLFHGGPHQENMMSQAMAIVQPSAAGGTPTVGDHAERVNKEGRLDWDPEGAPQRRKVREFLSIEDAPTEPELITRLIEASDRFYDGLGVNLLLPHYGQIGRYERMYKAYTHGGFMYRLDSLRKLGIRNIEVKGGEWRPERNREYPEVYEVEYP